MVDPGKGAVFFCRCAATALLLAVAGQGFAAESFRLDPQHTFVYFAVTHAGVSTLRGRFNIDKGRASLDTRTSMAEVEALIDTESVSTGTGVLDRLLREPEFFDTGSFPVARFVARATRFEDGMPREFEGWLTLRGRTRSLTLTAERFVCRDVKILVIRRYVCGGDLSAVVRRSDFGMDRFLDLVSDEVRLFISVEGIREDH
ncbi:YceI family protein [Pelomicrobium methylotrophicum]|uniref:YceI family protein n=1 Tax=Pelomicrobium methylotrophicum TaxID=2602750 RepID=A0A5C7EJY9_9PROT|nr:YceI family protein [Pelomicrobium methylotrophicum]TXF12838.1 YceI family protein [Pelomicrobium methylotrophicum]